MAGARDIHVHGLKDCRVDVGIPGEPACAGALLVAEWFRCPVHLEAVELG